MTNIYLKTIKFDRVYEIEKFNGKVGPQMIFKFDSGDTTNQKAQSNVHIDISAGATFTVAMAKENDLQSILGFWSPEQNKLFVRPTSLSDIVAMFALWAFGSAIAIVIILLAWDLWPVHRSVLEIIFILVLAILLYFLVVHRLILERRAAIALAKFAGIDAHQ